LDIPKVCGLIAEKDQSHNSEGKKARTPATASAHASNMCQQQQGRQYNMCASVIK
jgi:hypothetical protein